MSISPSSFVSQEQFVAEEIKHYFKLSGITMANAATWMGITEKALRLRLTGKRPLSGKTIEELSRTFGFNKEFLSTGNGPIIGTSDGPVIDLPEETPARPRDVVTGYGPGQDISHELHEPGADGDGLAQALQIAARLAKENDRLRVQVAELQAALRRQKDGDFYTVDDLKQTAGK